ncbi:MAG TPA: hypothetical protein VFR27_09325 [Mycobacterium sp.]|nr:hypothetical protein [Mycobacterium sp.]
MAVATRLRVRSTSAATSWVCTTGAAVFANEMTCAEAARRRGITTVTMTERKPQFLAAGAERRQEVP